MAESSVDVVRELFERFNSGDRDSVVELLAEDFVAEVPPSLSAEPDVYEGRAGALRYLEGFDGLLEEVRFEPLEFHEHADKAIVDVVLAGRGVASGIEVTQRVAVIVWVEEGKVKRTQPFPDLEAAREHLRAVG